MNNYQLLSTNVLLGGQMKWNLQINNYGDELYIDDFFLSPISKWIPYSKPDRLSLNYSHDENIKDLYNTIRSDFFETKLDPRLNTKLPIITETPGYIDTYCDMYDMGVSRISKSQMGKSLQIFCPLWLEDFNENNVITFRISIFTKQTVKDENGVYNEYKDLDITKDLKLQIKNGRDYHNKFIEYFNQYINSISEYDNALDKTIIGDKLLNIDLNNSYMSIEGINVENGKKTNKNISYSLPNIISRFKPMMDTDNLIISNFPNNNIICKQLFNFNLIFDVENILSYHLFSQLTGKELFFEVKCFIDKKELEMKSFSCDYSKDFNIKNSNSFTNTLDFFEDYNSISLIDKNKLSPQIIHWSSVYDNDYIFNIYPDAVWNTNLWGTSVKNDKLCLHWCNNDLMFNIDTAYKSSPGGDMDKDNNLLSLIKRRTLIENYSKFKPSKIFINNVLYDYKKTKLNDFDEIRFYINVIKGLIDQTRISGDFINENAENLLKLNLKINKYSDKRKDVGYIYKRTDNIYNILIDEDCADSLSFNMMINYNAAIIDNLARKKNFLGNFKFNSFLSCVQDSKIITINNSVSINKADSPSGYSNRTTEVNYGKTKIPSHYIFRTDGHIKPAFVNYDERKYYMIKKITRKTYDDTWDKLVKTNFPALYPSIDYFYIEEVNETNKQLRKIETRWFNNSKVLILFDNINFTIEKNVKDDTKPIKEDLIILLKNYYNINDNDGEVIEYIYNLYNIDMYFDYLYENSVDDYKYIVKMTLK